jgi:hypothetical protein
MAMQLVLLPTGLDLRQPFALAVSSESFLRGSVEIQLIKRTLPLRRFLVTHM